MGRIRFITIRIALYTTGYDVHVAVFGEKGVIRDETFDRLTWREALQVQDAVTEQYRPGLELMEGGVQLPLF